MNCTTVRVYWFIEEKGESREVEVANIVDGDAAGSESQKLGKLLQMKAERVLPNKAQASKILL